LSEQSPTASKLPAKYGMDWFGSAPHGRMHEIAATADAYIRLIAESSEWDLMDLDGLTFTDNYVGALASIDRGKPGMRAPVPTVTEYGSGSAMTLGVIRDGQLRFRLVVNVNDLLHLLETDETTVRNGLYTLAHELAHVELCSLFYRSFPDAFGECSGTSVTLWTGDIRYKSLAELRA
jgi:hypothetical protein